MAEVPMFPLGQPLLPGGLLPLYLFETRYLTLYEDLLAGEGRFGVVLIERGADFSEVNDTYDVGCLAHLLGSALNEDGTITIVAVGTDRFRVVRWLDPDPYPRADIELLDEGIPTPESLDLLTGLLERLPRLLALQSELHTGPARRLPDFDSEPVSILYEMANLMGLQALDAQLLLESRSFEDRVHVVDRLLSDLIELTELQLSTG